jgi:ribosomal protein L21E
MPNWKEGDRVRIIVRPVTDEDRKKNRYYDHMGGLVGTIQNVYGMDEVAVKIDLSALSEVSLDVHSIAVQRMRDKFLSQTGEEQKKQLTPEELNFGAHYMLLVRNEDLEKETA